MTVICNYLEDVIENVWCPDLCAKLNTLFEVIHSQLISNYKFVIHHVMNLLHFNTWILKLCHVKEAWLVLFLKFSLNDAEGYVIQHEMCKCPSCCRVVDISWIFMWDVVISKIILNVVFSKLHIIVQWSVVYTCVVCYLNTCSVKNWQYPDINPMGYQN